MNLDISHPINLMDTLEANDDIVSRNGIRGRWGLTLLTKRDFSSDGQSCFAGGVRPHFPLIPFLSAAHDLISSPSTAAATSPESWKERRCRRSGLCLLRAL